jgi:hypothetical protein
MFGLVGDGPANQRELAWAEIGRADTVPALWLQKLDSKETRAQGRSFSYEEVKEYSQMNRETRLSASAKRLQAEAASLSASQGAVVEDC